ncbi:Topoisomerase 1-associated factor 1 [Teratosphaeria destructans]|uniref:Topoisomerase 1-associated factor 1 n=1 Tax=Teratosphaeria destructans TaxID=418781 RepID=A0A9W7W222_9PEZI|nr:Topoisomerase 1-associated factor 1 [Teratosphaeria destructans]
MADPWEKTGTVDAEVRAYISNLVNAVGGSSTDDDTSYAVGDDALPALNDLLRWLRLYDERLGRHDVKRCLAHAALLQHDLLEILALWPQHRHHHRLPARLALACLQLMVPLTWPLDLPRDTATVNHARHVPYLQLAHVAYKRAILHYEHAKILRTVVRCGLASMAVERRERSKRDEGIIKLVLYLVRNVAMITQPQMLPSQGDENDISRAATIEAFAEQDILDLLLTIGSGASDDFQDQDVILLEILFHLLKGVDAKKLFMQETQLQADGVDELKILRQKEKAMLGGYNRHVPTRHNRFGTMIWVKRDDMKVSTVSGQQSVTDEATTLHQMDASKKWNKPKYRGKMAQEFNEQSDIGVRVDLPDSARKRLRTFVEDFLDSSFNPLFSGLRKAIERDSERVGDVHRRQYFYLIHWFLNAECSRRDHARRETAGHADRPTQTNPEDNTFAYIAAVLDQETFVLLNRHMQKAYDEKSWQDLQTTLLCFTQILLTVQSMAESKDEEDQEIAENIQNRIFYEEATHDRIVQILRGYSNQGFAYLDAITECVHVFVRMLERYSKQNVDLQVRSKRRARRKAKKANPEQAANAGEEAEQDAEDEREAHIAVSERKFDFAKFSAKFLSQPCVDTFISLLHFYADLHPSQLKRCHRYLYRLAFKHDLALLLFRVDILALLHRLIRGPNGLSSELEGFKEWEQLVQQIFRRCTKWLDKETAKSGWKEMCVVEMLFSKIPATLFYLQNGYERVMEKRAPRAPAELEFKAAAAEEQRVPVAVSLLIEQGKGDVLAWLKKELETAAGERRKWSEEQTAFAEGFGEDGVQAGGEESRRAPSITLVPDSDERKMALFKDKHLRLLLATLGMKRFGAAEDVDASWIIPSDLSADQLQHGFDAIKKTEFDGLSLEEGQTATDLIRNKSRRAATTFIDDDHTDDEGGLSDIDDALFPPNLREKRKADDDADRPKKRRRLTQRHRKELTEEEVRQRAAEKQQRERERHAKIKSALFVTVDDDASDEEGDAEFFRREAELRARSEGVYRRVLAGEVQKKGEKRKKKVVEVVGEEVDEGDGTDGASVNRHRGRRMVSDRDGVESEASDEDEASSDDAREDAEEETPSTSPAARDPSPGPEKVVGGDFRTGEEEEGEEEEDVAPITKARVMDSRRRHLRAGFIVEDDSDEG